VTPRAGTYALVTGASSGIGEALARKLAERGHAVLLAARSKERLEELAVELSARHGVPAEAIAIDLSAPGAAEALFAATEGSGKPVDVLVNNAGFGLLGAEVDLPLPRVSELLRLNVLALAELTHLFLGAMRARRRGAILNVASTQAFLPVPYMAAYGASKAFIASFSEALHMEAAKDGITVTCLCPGYTRTGFQGVARMKGAEGTPFPEMRAGDVAEIGLQALARGRAVVVTHPFDRLWIFAGRFVPRSFTRRLAALHMASRLP
jgi:uncharacterized protein